MAIKRKRKKNQGSIFYTFVTVALLCAVLLSMVNFFYVEAEEEAYEMLHIQTKQIKDDITLQLLSDKENLVTMANFASKLYNDGESYSLMFDSFKPIGLIENIGILNPDNTFVTRVGAVNLDGMISFEEEKAKGEYISGRVKDLTRDNYEIIRSAVPIKSGDETVGILYGVIKLDTIGKKYTEMAKELDAQLFVYEKSSGNLVIDTIQDKLGNISFLKGRKYNKGYSYEEMMANDKGFTSFKSAYTGEDLYLHYSTIEDIGWMIMLARYESQVFVRTHAMSRVLLISFLLMIVIVSIYILILLSDEERRNNVAVHASNIRKLLLDVNQQQNNIVEALKVVCDFAKSRSVVFFDTDGEDYNYIMPELEGCALRGEDRRYFISEMFCCANELYKQNRATVGVVCIKANEGLEKANLKFYNFLKKHNIREITFAAVTKKNNHITILGAINPQQSKEARALAENTVVCFSIALYNKRYLNKTEVAATTDSLTGVSNRVAYKKDLISFDKEKPEKFSCIYIDVNELHLLNNKYGHAAGDEMLIFIANTLKEVFYGEYTYRMGGDEFLVFVCNKEPDYVKKNIEDFIEKLRQADYRVAIGMSFRTQNTNTEEMVREAELRMYEAKAQYYQNKETERASKGENEGYVHVKTGISEIDTMISVMKEHYNGIYKVSIDSDKVHGILMPAYLGYKEEEEHFSKLFAKYVEDVVHPDYHRAVTNFLNYDVIRSQLLDGKTPKIKYKKSDNQAVVLSVYKLGEEESVKETLWVFAKE